VGEFASHQKEENPGSVDFVDFPPVVAAVAAGVQVSGIMSTVIASGAACSGQAAS